MNIPGEKFGGEHFGFEEETPDSEEAPNQLVGDTSSKEEGGSPREAESLMSIKSEEGTEDAGQKSNNPETKEYKEGIEFDPKAQYEYLGKRINTIFNEHADAFFESLHKDDLESLLSLLSAYTAIGQEEDLITFLRSKVREKSYLARGEEMHDKGDLKEMTDRLLEDLQRAIKENLNYKEVFGIERPDIAIVQERKNKLYPYYLNSYDKSMTSLIWEVIDDAVREVKKAEM